MGLLSKPYMRMQSLMHEENAAYGSSGHYHVGWVTKTLVHYEGKSLLDYGCGKQTLKNALPPQFEYRGYDPAFQETREPAKQADVVALLDVMEHIEPDYLKNVLKDIHRVTAKAAIMTVSTRPAQKTLPDGRNAHLIVQPAIWWLMQLDHLFEVQFYQRFPDFFLVEVTPR